MNPRILIAGCGDVGQRIGVQLAAAHWQVFGLRRHVAALPAGIDPVAGDLFSPECPAQWPEGGLDYVVYCAAASQHDEAGYRAAYVSGLEHVLSWLVQHQQRPKRVFFTSSSGVYGQTDGQWIDEQSPALANGFSGRIMREAEALVLDCGLPATVVRLTGLYGPGRERLLNQVRAGAKVPSEPLLYTNRIHVDDAAGLVVHLLRQAQQNVALAPCYLGVDDEPVALQTVVAWLREQLAVPTELQGVTLGRAGSKRCSNLLARSTGWAPNYASYREGYAALLSAGE